MSKLKTVKRFAVGTTMAAAAGYVAGLLTAPQSGKETRGELLDAADHSRARVEKQLKEIHTELNGLLENASQVSEELGWRGRRELKDLMDEASGTKQKVREVLSAIHDGEADDRDLKKAVKDASKAIDHLRKFIQK
jgi:gas vesicle protein